MGAFPTDAKEIFAYLTGHGYSEIAAAGILGNIGVEGPSGPESQGTGGGGLIGWTPESSAFPITPIVTGHPKTDLEHQLVDLVAWGHRNNASPQVMNQAKTADEAAALWEQHAERAGIVDMAERQSIARQVLDAARSDHWPAGVGGTVGPTSGGNASVISPIIGPISNVPGFGWIGSLITGFSGTASDVADVATSLGGFVTDISKLFQWVSWIFQPSNWVRILAGWAGLVLAVAGTLILILAVK